MSRDCDDRSADMRLVELQRARLELPERPTTWTPSATAVDDVLAGAMRVELAEPPVTEAMIFGSLHVAPSRGLVPGALVTVTLVVENAGGAPAAVRARLMLSFDAKYRLGSTALDGREIRDVDEGSVALAARGADLGAIAPAG